MTQPETPKDLDLDALFDQAWQAPDPEPSTDLMARILADAAQVQAEAQAPAPLGAVVSDSGGVATGLWQALGGWLGAAGFAGVAAAGVVLGIAPPDALLGVTDTLLYGAEVSFDGIGGFDSLVSEEI